MVREYSIWGLNAYAMAVNPENKREKGQNQNVPVRNPRQSFIAAWWLFRSL